MVSTAQPDSEIEVKPGINIEEALAQAAMQPVKRMSIQGAVQVKRGNTWVQRYASIKECVFSYKKDSCKSCLISG